MAKTDTLASDDRLLIEPENLSFREEEAVVIRDALRALRERRLIPDEEFPGTVLAMAIEMLVESLKARGFSSERAAEATIRFHERVTMMAAAYGTLTREVAEHEIKSLIAAGDTPLEQMVINLRVVRALNAREIADHLLEPSRIHVVTSRIQRRHPENRALVRNVERILKKHRSILEAFKRTANPD